MTLYIMGLFGNSSPFDQDVERATSENNTQEEWGLIMEICDRAAASPAAARDCLRAVLRRLGHPDPHVQVLAATLLDACVANCGRAFHLEVASRDFETEFRRLLTRAQPPVALRLRKLLRKWADNEFRSDPQLDLIPSLHAKLRLEAGERAATPAALAAAGASPSPPPALAHSAAPSPAQREQEELARAIALSLRDAPSPAPAPGPGPAASLYPRVDGDPTGPAPAPAPAAGAAPARKVRALYDFEAAEDNELTFLAGEIVHVTDSGDPNWWKGYNERGEGLFPANFVTADLAAPPPDDRPAGAADPAATPAGPEAQAQAQVQVQVQVQPLHIDEACMDAALALLHEADPGAGGGGADEAELVRLERAAGAMGALVDAALERADRRHARLTQLSADLVDALNLYHELMRDPTTCKPPYMQHVPAAPGAGPGPGPYAAQYPAAPHVPHAPAAPHLPR